VVEREVALTVGVWLDAPEGNTSGADFSKSATDVGDLDGDGLADLALGCSTCDDNSPVYLYLAASLPTRGTVAAVDVDLRVVGNTSTATRAPISRCWTTPTPSSTTFS
jgi:hypothetical protein